MAVPKQRHTKSRRNRRRMHIFIKPSTLVECSKCGKLTVSHSLCWNCGYYKKREIVDIFKKLTKKEKEIAIEEKQKKGKLKELDARELSKR